MAKRLPSMARKTACAQRRAPWQPAPAVVPLLLGLGLATMIYASAVRNETPARVPTPAPELPATPTVEAPPRPAAAAEADIEAVASAVARRYRISQAATRELVGTAYAEGRRIGLDPLLIIAVMAVESRFNPIAQSDGGAIGLMQVIPRYHADKFDAARGNSVLDPSTNIEVGARVLKDYIRRGGTEVAGLQLYNGASADPSNGYANKVLGERQRLQEAVRRSHDRSRA